MNEPKVQALRLLLAAYETRDVYGADHLGSSASTTRFVEAMREINKTATTVTLAIVAGGILIDGTVVSDRWAIDAALIVHLKERGVQVVRMNIGIEAGDLQWLFDAAKQSTVTSSPSRRIVLGQVRDHAETGGSAAPSVVARVATGESVKSAAAVRAASLVDPLRATWSAVLSPGCGTRDVRIASLAARIIAAGVQNRQNLIPLLDLKSHDEYTFVHVTNVAIVASAIGEAIGIAGDDLQHLTEAALLHDVGKWTIPKRILSKRGQLDESELAVMRMHPVVGATILAGARGVSDVAIVTAFEHHLRIDGKGYPSVDARRRPLVQSQIVQMADIFDALRSNRPYRMGLPLNECLAILAKEAGHAFDRELYKTFCERVISRVPSKPEAAASPDQQSAAA